VTVTLKDLGNGQLAATKGTLYTVPGATNAAARVLVVNTDSTARTVNLYTNKTGTSRRICPKDMSLGAGEPWETSVQTLEAGDLIEGEASAATVVDYVVNGFEVT
jgi:hypothetical protein